MATQCYVYAHKTLGSFELNREQFNRLKQLRAALTFDMHFLLYSSVACGAYVLNGLGTVDEVKNLLLAQQKLRQPLPVMNWAA